MTGIEGDLKFGTTPIRSCYMCLSSTRLQSDFDSMAGTSPGWLYKRLELSSLAQRLRVNMALFSTHGF